MNVSSTTTPMNIPKGKQRAEPSFHGSALAPAASVQRLRRSGTCTCTCTLTADDETGTFHVMHATFAAESAASFKVTPAVAGFLRLVGVVPGPGTRLALRGSSSTTGSFTFEITDVMLTSDRGKRTRVSSSRVDYAELRSVVRELAKETERNGVSSSGFRWAVAIELM